MNCISRWRELRIGTPRISLGLRLASLILAVSIGASSLHAETVPASQAPAHVGWTEDLAAAQVQAKAEGKNLLLFFTGSDWCGPCIKLESTVLTKPEFQARIADKFVPVLLDFPVKKELPEALKTQNDHLKSALGVKGFPTICTASPDGLPFGKFTGYSGVESFWEDFGKAEQQGAQLQEATGGVLVSAITDPVVLDRVLAVLPTEVLRDNWLEIIEREIALSETGHPELKAKWSSTLMEVRNTIADEEFVTQVDREFRRFFLKPGGEKEIPVLLERRQAEAENRPARLGLVLTLKMTFLDEQNDPAELLVIADQLANAEWATPANRRSAVHYRRHALLRLGRIDEGLATIDESVRDSKLSSDAEREILKEQIAAYDLNTCGHPTLALPRLKSLHAQQLPNARQSILIAIQLEKACEATGSEHQLRGEALLFLAQKSKVEAKSGKVALAAVCFRAADRDDLVREAASQVAPVNEEKPAEAAAAASDATLAFSPQQLLEVASKSPGDALHYLGERAQGLGKGIYLFEAALALRQENRSSEATALIEQANQILAEAIADKPNDVLAFTHLQNLARQCTEGM